MKNTLFVLLLLPLFVHAQIISTIAGVNIAGYTGNGGPATIARINHPNQITLDPLGNVYIAESENNVIRKIGTDGIITLVAGNSYQGYSGDGGPATAAMLNTPLAVRFDDTGNMYIPCAADNRIRKVNTSGIISTIAGNGSAGYAGDGGLASAAAFDGPFCLAFDSHGDMFVADNYNNCIRKIEMTTGTITTVAGTGVAGYSGDGGPATAATFDGPIDLAFDKAGNMYVADILNSAIRKIDDTGGISTICGNGFTGYTGDGGPAGAATLAFPYALCLDTAGNIYISDNANAVIRKIVAATGIIETVAGSGSPGYSGDGGPATDARINNAGGVVTDEAGNIYIAGYGNHVVRKVANTTTSVPTATSIQYGAVIAPNPASGVLTVSAPYKLFHIELLDLNGRVLKYLSPGVLSTRLDVSDLPPQVYLLRINGNETLTFVRK